MRLDCGEARGAVVEDAGEDHPDDTRAVRRRGCAEHRVDRRAVAVFLRPAIHAHEAGLDQQVVVRRGDVDPPALDLGAVLCVG